jgi:RNA-directed DNA polymerase
MAPPPAPPQSLGDVARLLGVSAGYLKVVLNSGLRYTVFHIPKKSGGEREVAAPLSPLKDLQKKLLAVLESYYSGRSPAHGFIKGRSIVSNAKVHAKARYVLNIDLEDFFPNIHFGRVRGLLRGKPYFFGRDAAKCIANLCCRMGKLPQGGPASPIISNMICGKLDADMKRLAKKYYCTYTRYADDLTFSTGASSFPKAIAYKAHGGAGDLALGDELKNAIQSNGFNVNLKKVRLATKHQRQEVTGLTTNRFPNVQRRFVRQVRAMLHAWKKYSYELAQEEFWQRYDRRFRGGRRPQFSNVVRGKIEFIGSVRGKSDPLYWRLLRQYAALDTTCVLKEPDEFVEYDIQELKSAIWVLMDKSTYNQSTAFSLKSVGIVTCDHGITDESSLVLIDASDPLETEYKAEVVRRDQKLDLAILRATVPHPKEMRIGEDAEVKQRDPIRLMGFPAYHKGAEVSMYEGYVVNEYQVEHIRRLNISAPIIPGNSGGPVLNKGNRVIGVAIKGGAGELNGVVPISLVFRIGPPT